MKITVTFETLDEFKEYMGIQSPSKIHLAGYDEATQAPKAAPEPVKGSTPKKNPKKDTAPAPEAAGEPEAVPETAPAPEPEKDEPAAPEVTEEFRVEVRKTLAQLNKKVGKNMASELIKKFGVEKLTDVALSDLPALMDRAKEALNAE